MFITCCRSQRCSCCNYETFYCCAGHVFRLDELLANINLIDPSGGLACMRGFKFFHFLTARQCNFRNISFSYNTFIMLHLDLWVNASVMLNLPQRTCRHYSGWVLKRIIFLLGSLFFQVILTKTLKYSCHKIVMQMFILKIQCRAHS